MRKQIVGVVGAAAIAAGLVAAAPAANAAPDGTTWFTFELVSTTSTAPAKPAPAPKPKPKPKPAAPKHSSVGGPISRAEVISRAKFWYDHRSKFSYSWTNYYPDPEGKTYRQDCSGFVSMALHLNTSLSTVTLPGVGTKIARGNMQAGDFTGHLGAGTGGAGGHVRIFEKWANKSAGTYWGYDFGSTPVKHQIYRLSTDVRNGQAYTAYRYKKIR